MGVGMIVHVVKHAYFEAVGHRGPHGPLVPHRQLVQRGIAIFRHTARTTRDSTSIFQ